MSASPLSQNPLLRDECGDRCGGGQGRADAAGSGDEEDGAVCGQTGGGHTQHRRQHTGRRAGHREEVCVLKQRSCSVCVCVCVCVDTRP